MKREDKNNPYSKASKRLVPSKMKPSKRLSGLTPDGLRKRVLDALPLWESYPRLFRRVLILLPTHGDVESIAEELKVDPVKLQEKIDKRHTYASLVKYVQEKGHYPMCVTSGEYLKHPNLVEQYANEMSVSAVINLETNAGQSPINHKIVDSAGWFANIEYDTQRYRLNKQRSIDKYAQKLDAEPLEEEVQEPEEGLKPFVRDINPESLNGTKETSKVSKETNSEE